MSRPRPQLLNRGATPALAGASTLSVDFTVGPAPRHAREPGRPAEAAVRFADNCGRAPEAPPHSSPTSEERHAGT